MLWQVWAGRSVWKALLLVGLAVATFQVYKKWRQRRALSRLAGKVVLITGASSGLGEALARLLHSVGAKVILASRDVQKLQALKFQLDHSHAHKSAHSPHHSPKVLPLDLSQSLHLPGKVEEVVQAFGGRLDILVNNAGISSRGSVLDTDLSVDRKVMEINFFGTVALTKAVLPVMVSQGGGHVVVISSLQGKMGLPFRSSYSASKHALHGYFNSLRCELAHHNIRVTLACPGYINTNLSRNALDRDGSKHGVMDRNTASGMSADHVAHQLILGISEHARELVLATPTQHLAVYLGFLCPSLLDWLLRKRAKVTLS